MAFLHEELSPGMAEQKSITIALDAMGGDHGPESVIPGAAIILKEMPDLRFMLFGDQTKIQSVLSHYPALAKVCTIHHCEKVILDHDKPSSALRNGKNTSMRLAIEAVDTKQADAAVSGGNTGALMAMAKMILKTLPGIHRPAICSLMPALNGQTVMLDLGANVLVDAENLVQFAVMGAVFAKAHKNIDNPSVGLLNVGSEDTKGPDHVREAASILATVDIPGRYIGFVEGNDITKGVVDVVVSDGYAGNIALKAIEGVGKFAGQVFKQTITSDPLAIMGGVLAFFALKRFKNKIDPRLYNGGVMLGLNGICVKSHGSSDALGFSSAIRLAVELVQHGYISTVGENIRQLLEQESQLAGQMAEKA